jgi:hypothetical protein
MRRATGLTRDESTPSCDTQSTTSISAIPRTQPPLTHLNSPSLTPRRPASSCSLTTSLTASSSTFLSSASVRVPAKLAALAAWIEAGRRNEPTIDSGGE